MSEPRVAFFDTKKYDREFFDAANERYGLTIKYFPAHLSDDTAPLTAGYDAVCTFVNDNVSASVVDVLDRNGIRLIALRCAGYNSVDLKAVFGRIHVVRVPAYSPYAVAEYAVAMMLTLNRKTHKAYNRTRENNFAIQGLLGFDMRGKTAGVVGTGKIGRAVARILRGFGMEVLVHDTYPDAAFATEIGACYVDLETLYRRSDIVTLHCPLTPETRYMINAASLALMKDGVMLINTGRGKLINSRDLLDGLKSRRIGSAGLDVYEEEDTYFFEDFSGQGVDDDVLARLLTFPNVLVTSHQAFFTQEALTAIADTTLANIHAFFTTGSCENEICYHCDQQQCTKKLHGRCF